MNKLNELLEQVEGQATLVETEVRMKAAIISAQHLGVCFLKAARWCAENDAPIEEVKVEREGHGWTFVIQHR